MVSDILPLIIGRRVASDIFPLIVGRRDDPDMLMLKRSRTPCF